MVAHNDNHIKFRIQRLEGNIVDAHNEPSRLDLHCALESLNAEYDMVWMKIFLKFCCFGS